MTEATEMLAQYNAERARGIVHTPEWTERMAVLQARFDERVREEARIAAEDFIRQRRSEIGLSTPIQGPWLLHYLGMKEKVDD